MALSKLKTIFTILAGVLLLLAAAAIAVSVRLPGWLDANPTMTDR